MGVDRPDADTNQTEAVYCDLCMAFDTHPEIRFTVVFCCENERALLMPLRLFVGWRQSPLYQATSAMFHVHFPRCCTQFPTCWMPQSIEKPQVRTPDEFLGTHKLRTAVIGRHSGRPLGGTTRMSPGPTLAASRDYP